MSKRVSVTLDDVLYDRFIQAMQEQGYIQTKGNESAAIARMIAFYCDKNEIYAYILSRLVVDLEPIIDDKIKERIHAILSEELDIDTIDEDK
ncbi:MAG: hypothetical protein WC138_12350 [Methanoculleus sp.]|jgi:hypothetical protein